MKNKNQCIIRTYDNWISEVCQKTTTQSIKNQKYLTLEKRITMHLPVYPHWIWTQQKDQCHLDQPYQFRTVSCRANIHSPHYHKIQDVYQSFLLFFKKLTAKHVKMHKTKQMAGHIYSYSKAKNGEREAIIAETTNEHNSKCPWSICQLGLLQFFFLYW